MKSRNPIHSKAFKEIVTMIIVFNTSIKINVDPALQLNSVAARSLAIKSSSPLDWGPNSFSISQQEGILDPIEQTPEFLDHSHPTWLLGILCSWAWNKQDLHLNSKLREKRVLRRKGRNRRQPPWFCWEGCDVVPNILRVFLLCGMDLECPNYILLKIY